jgi:putative SOS response-associated peptidase YedK
MCGRYTIRRIDLFIRFGAMEPPPFEEFTEIRIDPVPGSLFDPFKPRYNVAPSQLAPIIRTNREGKPTGDMVTWGLVPSWTKGQPKMKPINARCETAATSGMFREAFERRRCLVPADGFYEWRGAKPPKQPMFIRLPDDRPFAFAGLWERWRPEPGVEPVDTFTILTTSANAEMMPIHNRMPVILRERDYARWLDRSVPGRDVIDLLRPFDDGVLQTHSVSTQVNKPANDGPDLVKPVECS